MYLFISTSRGIIKYDLKTNKYTFIISNWHKGIFRKKSKGFFGISSSNINDFLFFSSRENYTKDPSFFKSKDTIIHLYDIKINKFLDRIVLNGIYDAHQIFSNDEYIYITDTGKNRVVVFNYFTKKIFKILNVGKIRSDINHINSIVVKNNILYIGFNNGNKNNLKFSEILQIPLSKILFNDNFEIDALESGNITVLKNTFHTHDLLPFEDDFLISKSEDGTICKAFSNVNILKINKWTRGIALNNNNIFVGKSLLGPRSLRHSRYNHGEVFIIDRITFKINNIIKIKRIGQLNDILFVQ